MSNVLFWPVLFLILAYPPLAIIVSILAAVFLVLLLLSGD
jgi:hypothetical protein